jgi:hypothetical protein
MEMLAFDPRIRGRAAPVDPAARRVAPPFPGAHFLAQPLGVRRALTQTLAHPHAERDLRGCPPGGYGRLPCSGVWWISNRCASRFASVGANASQSEAVVWVCS